MTEPKCHGVVRIDPEFKALIPRLSPEEVGQLEENLRMHGCRDSLVTWRGVLLDGHHRLAICQTLGLSFKTTAVDLPDREAAKDWIEANQLGRRNLTPDQASLLRGRRYQRMKKSVGKPVGIMGQSDPISTAETLAHQHGVSPSTIKRDAKRAEFVDSLPAERQRAVLDGTTTISKEIRRTRHVADEAELEAAQTKITTDARQNLASVCEVRVCSCADLFASGIRPDAVITDPPYQQEFLSVFSELAKACASADVPLVAVMSGQSYLPEVLRLLCEHLVYRWTLAYLTPGGQAVQQWSAKVNTTWKPVLLFGDATDWFGDVATSKPNDNDKRFHGWGQSESGMADLVERLTKPGQLVCDPFVGGGTLAVVALALGRRFVGCDVDSDAVKIARQRIEVAYAREEHGTVPYEEVRRKAGLG